MTDRAVELGYCVAMLPYALLCMVLVIAAETVRYAMKLCKL